MRGVKNLGYIYLRAKYNALGQVESIDSSWQGGEVAILSDRLAHYISKDISALEPGGIIAIGPYRLRILQRCPQLCGWYAMRDGLRARIRVLTWPVLDVLCLTKSRTIITLAVWGLADYGQGRIPMWSDVSLVKRLLRCFEQCSKFLRRNVWQSVSR